MIGVSGLHIEQGGGPVSNGLLTDLGAYYRMNETSGSMLDAHVNGLHSSYVGSVTRSGSDYYFAGSSPSYVRVSSSSFLSPIDQLESYALSLWVKTTGTSGWALYRGFNASNREYAFTILPAGYGYGTLYHLGGTTINSVSSSVIINDGIYHHVVVSAYGGFLSIYIDGIKRGTTAITYNMIWASSHLYFGCYGALSSFWTGYMKHFGFWRSGFDDGGVSDGSPAIGKIATLYNGGTPFDYSLFNA